MTDRELLERSPPGWDGPPLVIRTYEPRDRDAVWDLHVEGLIDMNTWDDNRDPQWDADVRDVEPYYLVPGSHFWVVESPDPRPSTRDLACPLIATSAVRRHDDTTAEIKRMRVTKAYRRRGIARLLVDVAEDFCRRNGYTRIVLDTTDRQQPAQCLYESLGYTRTGRPLARTPADPPPLLRQGARLMEQGTRNREQGTGNLELGSWNKVRTHFRFPRAGRGGTGAAR